jgi:hypothetical protein
MKDWKILLRRNIGMRKMIGKPLKPTCEKVEGGEIEVLERKLSGVKKEILKFNGDYD